MNPLVQLLAILRAVQWSHQHSHWSAKGPTQYSDHLLFERLYTGMDDEIDALAEKIIGTFGPDALVQTNIMRDSLRFLDAHPVEPSTGRVEHALAIENRTRQAIAKARRILERQGKLSAGLDDYLAETDSHHETAEYLLSARLA